MYYKTRLLASMHQAQGILVFTGKQRKRIMDKLLVVAYVFAALSAFSYVLVMVLLTIGFLRHQKPSNIVPSNTKPFVSIVVAARNESACIKSLLDSLVEQHYPIHLLEILVVDDHSTDATRVLASSYQRVKLIELTGEGIGFGKKAALKEGVRQSIGQVLLFTDADCVMGPDWVASMVESLQNSKASFVGGAVVLDGHTGVFSQLQQLEFVSLMASTVGSIALGYPLMANGANYAITRAAWDSTASMAQGQQQASGDDMFLMLAIQKLHGRNSVVFNANRAALVSTSVKPTFAENFQQRARWVSKSGQYSQPWVIITGVIVALLNALIIGFLGIGVFMQELLLCSLLLFGLKTIIDFPIMMLAASKFRKARLMLNYLLLQLVYPAYVLISITWGHLNQLKWKGRDIDDKGRFS